MPAKGVRALADGSAAHALIESEGGIALEAVDNQSGEALFPQRVRAGFKQFSGR